jgi:hypothetical protein
MPALATAGDGDNRDNPQTRQYTGRTGYQL